LWASVSAVSPSGWCRGFSVQRGGAVDLRSSRRRVDRRLATTLAVYLVVTQRLGLGRTVAVLAVGYNLLLVTVKFVLAPLLRGQPDPT
jgi:hypothetical protein